MSVYIIFIRNTSSTSITKSQRGESAASGSAVDLLGAIMQDQKKLNLQSRDITIQKDGK